MFFGGNGRGCGDLEKVCLRRTPQADGNLSDAGYLVISIAGFIGQSECLAVVIYSVQTIRAEKFGYEIFG